MVSISLCLAFGWQKKETYLYQQHAPCFPETVHKSWGTAVKMVCEHLGWVFQVHAGFLAAWFPSILTASLLLRRIGTPCQTCPWSLGHTRRHLPSLFSHGCSCVLPQHRHFHLGSGEQTIWLLWDLTKALSCTSSFSHQPSSCWVVFCFSNGPAGFCTTVTPHMTENSSFVTFRIDFIRLKSAGLLAPRHSKQTAALLSWEFC